MGVGALAPALLGAGGAGAGAGALALPALGLFGKLAGGGQGGGQSVPASNPFFGEQQPPQQPPAPPVSGMQAEVARNAPQKPRRDASVVTTDTDYIPARPMLDSDMLGPGSSHPKTRPATNQELAKRAGQDTETVYAQEVDDDTPPDVYSRAKDAAPIQSATESAQPRSLFDDVPAAEPKSPQGAQKQAGMAEVPPMPGQRPPNPKSSSFFDDVLDTVGYGVGEFQDKLGETSTNPLFQMGMGLLASGYDGSNPYTNIQKGLSGVQPAMMQQAMADYKIRSADRTEQDAAREKELMQALAALGMKYDGGSKQKEAPRSRQAAGGARVVR